MSQDITELRRQLFATLAGVKDGSLDIERARAVNEISKTLVDSARVEVDYLRATGGGESKFLETPTDPVPLPPGITGRTVHRCT
jgi:hypothetical protein